MKSFVAAIAASALLNSASAIPFPALSARSATCGVVPAGADKPAPLSQPTGINTAADCLARCNADPACNSFAFGMLDEQTIECMLYSVSAASIPPPASSNILAYDKACPSIPSVKPTPQNPTGTTKGSGAQAGNNASNGNKPANNNNGNQGQAQGQGQAQAQGQAQGQQGASNSGKAGGPAKRDANPPPPPAHPPHPLRAASPPPPPPPSPKPAPPPHPPVARTANVCGGAPAGAASLQPIQTIENSGSQADCLAKCKANAACKSFEFGTLVANGPKVCRLFQGAAAQVPAPGNGQSFQVFDVSCSL